MTNLIETINEGTKKSEENVEKRRLALKCALMLIEENTDVSKKAAEGIYNWLDLNATIR